jgi:hypothetical protein
MFKGTDDYEVVIDFDAWATDLVRGRHGISARSSPNCRAASLESGCV